MDVVKSPATEGKPPQALQIGLWVAQLLLALAFGAAGAMKVSTPVAELAKKLAWVADAPWLLRFIGASELAGALGLVLPASTRILPILTPLAGVGLAIIMVLATGFHVMRGELSALPITLGLGALAAFVAWGRLGPARVAPRG